MDDLSADISVEVSADGVTSVAWQELEASAGAGPPSSAPPGCWCGKPSPTSTASTKNNAK